MTTRIANFTKTRKALSILMALLMVVVLVPAVSFANESLGGGGASELTSGENTGSTNTPTAGGAGDTNNTQISGGTEGSSSSAGGSGSSSTEGTSGTEGTDGSATSSGTEGAASSSGENTSSNGTGGTDGSNGAQGVGGTEGENNAKTTGGDEDESTDESTEGEQLPVAGAASFAPMEAGGITPLDAGTITSATITVKADGEGWLDANNNPGNDSSLTNKIVRNNDIIAYELHYVVDTDGEVTLVVTLPDGMEWDASALVETKAGSSISTDGKTLTAVRDVSGAANLELKARVYNHNQGDKVKIASATIGGVTVTGLDTTEVTVSAAPNYRITTGDTNGRLINNGPNQDASNNFSTQVGARIGYSFGLYAVIDPNKGVKGIAPLGSCTFEVTTSVPTAVYSFSASGTASMNSFPLINSGTQSYLEKGLVNKHTITYSGFDTSFRSARPTTTYVGSAVPDFAHYIKVVRVDFWAPASSLSTTSGTANTMTLLSTTPGMDSGTPGLTSYASGGIRNTNNYAFPRLDNVVRQENYISSISGRAFDLHRGETCTFTVPTGAGGAMPTHTGLEIIASWDEDIAVFDPRANVSGQTINGVVYTVSYGHLDNPSDPSTLVGTWSTTKPGVDSNINAVRLTTNDPTATFPAGEGCTLLIPLVVKSDAPITNMNHYAFYTSEQQALTSLAESTNINPAGIAVDLAWQNEYNGANVQIPGSVQVLKMTPWVAGNNAGTYSSRDYLTPTTGTAQDLQVTVTIPNAAHLPVLEAELIAELSKTYPGLGASVASAVVGGNTVLTFNFASAVTHNGALPTLNIPVSATIGTTTGTYDATAVISSVSDNINQNYRQDSARISFNQLSAFAMQKTVNTRFAQPGSEVIWTLRYVNFSTKEATGVKLVDVLPYNGDARGTTGLGAPLVVTAVNAGSATVEYTTDAAAGVVTALEADATGATGITWVAGTPSASDGATALRFTVGNVAVKGEGSVSFTTALSTFDFGSSLNNNAYGTTTDGLPTFKPAAPPVASSASVIEGQVYKDADFSGGYTGATLDDLQSNVVVTLTTTDTALQALLTTLFGDYTLTRTTNLLGEYHFEDLPAGNYTVSVPAQAHFRFIEPVGTNTHTVTLGANDSVTRDFGLQATRWNLAYDVNTPDGATTSGVTLPAAQPNISTASASTAVGAPTGVPVRSDGGGVYAFAGWATTAVRANAGTVDYGATATVPAQTADANYVLFAVWTYTATTWDLTFDANTAALPVGVDGSAISVPASQTGISTASGSASFGAPANLPAVASGTFSFAGWNTAPDGSGTAYAAGATVPKQTADTTVTLYAQWNYGATFWNLVFDLNAPADATGSPVAPAAQSNIPTGNASGAVGTITGQYPKTDGSGYYTFNQWASGRSGAVTLYGATDTVAAQGAGVTKTLYGTWELTLNSFGYTVTHHFVGGPSAGVSSVVETGTRAFGSFVSAAPSPYTGYTHNAGHPSAVVSGTVGTGGLALHLYYQALSYTVSYNANGGAGAPGTQSGDYLSSVTVAGQGGMTRGGYSFLGWSESATAGTPAWGAGGTITLNRNYTLYAVWSLDPTYSLTYAAGGDGVTGLPTGATGLAAGTGVTVGVAPAREGFVFVGFASSAGGTLQPADYFTMPAANVTLTALWEPASFSVSYAAGGTNVVGLPAGATFEVGATVTVGAAPSRAGFTFEGWASSAGGTLQPGATFVMPAADVVLTATWDEVIVPAPTPIEPLTPTVIEPGTDAVVTAALDQGIPIVSILGTDVPLFRPAGVNSWSLFDLICTLIALAALLIAGIYSIVRKRDRKDDEHEVSDVYLDKDGNVIYEVEQRKIRPVFLIALAIAAVIAVVLFIITQDLSAPVVLFDWWSIVFAILAIAALVFARVAFGKKKEDYQQDEPQDDQPAAGVYAA